MATPSAPPSIGSVPDPTSSRSTSAGTASSRSIAAMFVMCPENVLRLASIDCSSPMSAKSDRNTGTRDPSAAGMRSPACAIIASRPAVLSATVFPPVFGPVTSSVVAGGMILMVTGTGCFNSGWRAACSSNAPSVVSAGSMPSTDCEKRARACKTSSAVAASIVRCRSAARARNASLSASRIRCTSSCSCCSSATMSLLISTVLSGSRNRLAPLVEDPCTIPGIELRCSAFTTRT